MGWLFSQTQRSGSVRARSKGKSGERGEGSASHEKDKTREGQGMENILEI